jgi:hypothetical protein
MTLKNNKEKRKRWYRNLSYCFTSLCCITNVFSIKFLIIILEKIIPNINPKKMPNKFCAQSLNT